jgi:hypothetical protein
VIAVSGDNLCSETEHNEEGEADHAPAGIGIGGCDLHYDNIGTVLHCDDTDNPELTANGSFSTGAGGTAVITANTIADDSQRDSWSGIFTLTGGGTNRTTVYGSQNLARDFAIGAGDTLTIEANGSLTVNENVTLDNSGTIVNYSRLMIAGTLTNHASINNRGTIWVAGTLTNLSESELGTVLYRIKVTGGTADAEYASPGTAVTLTPETAIPEGMTAVWKLGDEAISNSSFEMPARAVSVSYEGYKDPDAEDASDGYTPKLILGDGAEYDSTNPLVFCSDDTADNFRKVTVNGVELDRENYAVSGENIEISLNVGYLDTLKAGNYVIGILSANGEATGTFTIPPQNSEELPEQPPESTEPATSPSDEKQPGETDTDQKEPQETESTETDPEENATSPSDEKQPGETDTDQKEPQETESTETDSEETVTSPSGENPQDETDTDQKETQEAEQTVTEFEENVKTLLDESQPSDSLVSPSEETTAEEAAMKKTTAETAAMEAKTAKETTAKETTAKETTAEETTAEEITGEETAVGKTKEEESAVAAGELKPEETSAASDEETAAEDAADLSEEENQEGALGMELISAEDNSSFPVGVFLLVLAAVALGAEACRKKRQAAGAEK